MVYYEAADHAVKDQAVIEALVHQSDKVIDSVGCNFGIELCLERGAVLHGKGYDGI